MDFAAAPIVMPAGDEVSVETDIPFGRLDDGLKLDVYRPKIAEVGLHPGVFMVYGDADPETLRGIRRSGQYVGDPVGQQTSRA